jgi:hypothetical protein
MPERPVYITLLAVVGSVCLLLGLAFAIPGEEPGNPAAAVGLIGFGLFCLSAVFFVAAGLPYPARLIMDNAAGWLTLGDRRGALLGAVPYDGISGVSLLRTRAGGIMRHSVGLDFRGGGRWELYASRAQGRARRFAEELGSRVSLGAAVGEPPGSTPVPAARALPGGGTLYAWRRRQRVLPFAASLAAVLGFAAALVGVRPFTSGPAASAVALASAVLLLCVTAWGLIRATGERHEVEVTAGAVRSARRSALGRESGFTAPLSTIAAVDLSFSFTRMETAISLLGPGDVEPFTRYRQGAFPAAEALPIVAFLRGLRRIDVSALPAGERLGLAEALRSAVTAGGR